MFNIGAILDTTKSITPTNGLYFVNGVIGHAGGKVTYRTTRDAGMQIPYTLLTSYPDGNGGFSTTLLKFKKDMGNITNGGKSIQDILSVGSFGYYNDSLVDNPSNVIRNEAENSIRIAGNGPSTVTVAFSENVSPTNDISFEFGNGRWKKYAVDSVRDGDSITYNNEDFSVGYLADDSEQMTVLTKNDTSTLKAPPYRDVAKNLLIGYFYKNWLGSDSNTRVGVLDIPGGYRLLLLKDVVGGKAVMNGVDCQTVGITDIGFTCKKVSYPYASQVAVTAYSEVLHDNASTYSYYEVQSMNLLNATVSNETFKLTGSVFRTDVNNSSVMKRVADRTYYSAGLAGYMNFLSSPGDELSEDYMFIKPNSFEGNVLVNAKMKSKYTGVTFMASEVKGANVLSVYGPDNSKAVPGAFADIPDWTSADGCSNYSSSTKKVAYNTSCLTGLESNKVRVDLLAGKSKAELDSLFNVIVNTKDGFASDSIFTDKTMKPSDFPMTLNIAPSGTSSPNAIANFVLVSKIDGSKAFSDNITIRSKAIVGCSPSSTDGFLYDPAETHGVSVCKDVDDTQKGAGFTTFKVNLKEIQGKYLREGTINVCYDNPDYFELQPSSFFGQGQSAGYEGTYGKGGNSSDYRYSPKKMVMDGKSWTCHELKLADIFPGTYSDNSLFFVLKTKQQSVASVKRTTLRVIKDFKFYDLPGGYVDLS